MTRLIARSAVQVNVLTGSRLRHGRVVRLEVEGAGRYQGVMVTLLQTTDAVKLSAVAALLRGAGVETAVFDTAAGALWLAIIPMRLMVDESDLLDARRMLREAGFREAKDGDWDLRDQVSETRKA
jgi:hypothetical protein